MRCQKGIALIVSMVVLLVAALFGVSSFQSTQLEERMAGNHRFSVSALQAAEAGVSDMLGAVLDFTYNPGQPTFCDPGVMGSSLPGEWLESSPGSGIFSKTDVDITDALVDGSYTNVGTLTQTYSAIMKCQNAGVDSAHVIGYSRGVVPHGDYQTSRLIKVEIVPPGYDAFKSMLAEGNITVPGNSVINGDVHSNGDLSLKIRTEGNIKFDSSGTVTASGAADFEVPDSGDGSDCTDFPCTASYTDTIPVPEAQLYIDYITNGKFNEANEKIAGGYIEKVAVENGGGWKIIDDPTDPSFDASLADRIEVLPHDPVTGDCAPTDPLVAPGTFIPEENPDEIDLEGAQVTVKIMDKNYIYYCPGNLTTGATFEGVTVMAAGNITHSGAATVAAENLDPDTGEPITDPETGELVGVDTLVVSGGNIELNGTTVAETYAAFWSVGDFTQNGTSAIYGSVVAGGSILNNGGINFTAVDSSTLYKPVSGRLEGWAEQENPGDTDNLLIFLGW
ncbi:pilus assembly PilX family protein [Halomonas aquatica]|uniref:PilX N-terminal domain-containing pilus assembly protein n=1 Tax=Halomonas aquatica TaxID=3151123 RepID=A0ABV1NIB3_9GAMM